MFWDAHQCLRTLGTSAYPRPPPPCPRPPPPPVGACPQTPRAAPPSCATCWASQTRSASSAGAQQSSSTGVGGGRRQLLAVHPCMHPAWLACWAASGMLVGMMGCFHSCSHHACMHAWAAAHTRHGPHSPAQPTQFDHWVSTSCACSTSSTSLPLIKPPVTSPRRRPSFVFPAGRRFWAPPSRTSTHLPTCWRLCARRARWCQSPLVSAGDEGRWRSSRMRGDGGSVGGWHTRSITCPCPRRPSATLSTAGKVGARRLCFTRCTSLLSHHSTNRSARCCPGPPAADKLEAAHAERPGFFEAVKKVL